MEKIQQSNMIGAFSRAVFSLILVFGAAPTTHAEEEIAAVVRDYDAFLRTQDVVRAAERGDMQAARRWPDNSPSAVARRKADLQKFAARLDAIDEKSAAAEDDLNRDVLTDRVRRALDGLAFDPERIPFISGDGFYTTADYAALKTVIRNEADAEAWLARLDAVPDYYTREIANMRRGLDTGFVQSRLATERAIGDVRVKVEQEAAKSALLKPFDSAPADRRADWKAKATKLIETRVKPAHRELLTFLEREYLPKARTIVGAHVLPEGKPYYIYQARYHTTTELSPDDIHALGLKEMARIRGRMQETMKAAGFSGSLAEFIVSLRTDSRFYVKLDDYTEKACEIAKRADFQMPRYFGKLPRLTYGVQPMPAGLESSATGYILGSPERGVAGSVVYLPGMAEKFPTYAQAAFVLHEGMPGHHLQFALAQEQSAVPEFRRDADINAYTEGWGLYAEYLGEEMGIYRNPYELFGRLSWEMWRACRLVIDTGMHWKGWTRDQAVTTLKDNTALSPAEIEFEVDRYIAWPGQALAYKIGELKLIELRRRAEAALGPKFDLRAFHDFILGSGPLPLTLLEKRVDAWLAQQGRGT
jgi:uncharacterized protein (DUF885 family)